MNFARIVLAGLAAWVTSIPVGYLAANFLSLSRSCSPDSLSSPMSMPRAMRAGARSWKGFVSVPIDRTLSMAMMVDYIVEYALYGAIVGLVYGPIVRKRAA
jgi:membrane protease YdiL (CAAX protease family)